MQKKQKHLPNNKITLFVNSFSSSVILISPSPSERDLNNPSLDKESK